MSTITHMYTVENPAGVRFAMRAVPVGAPVHSRAGTLRNTGSEAIIEFFDLSSMRDGSPQFVSSYCRTTFMETASRGAGLLLNGGAPDRWFLSAENVQELADAADIAMLTTGAA